MEENVLSLNGDAFATFKFDFDKIMSSMLMDMERDGNESGEITAKITVTLLDATTPDFESENFGGDVPVRNIVKPTFEHKVTSVIQVKNSTSGYVGGNKELVFDKESKKYVLRNLEEAQMSFYSGGQSNV